MGDSAQSSGISYAEWLGALAKVTDRPPCEDCGSTHIISNGKQWMCRDCGRHFLKVRHNRAMPDFSARPACPVCGKYHACRNGPRGWICGECGKQWFNRLAI